MTQRRELVIEAAARARSQMMQRHDPLFLLTAARACYDARKFFEAEQAADYTAATIRFATQVIQSETGTAAQRAVGHQYVALGNSPSERSRTHLRKARALVLQSDEPMDVLARARVSCSLADELQRGPKPQLDLAREMYQESLALRERHFPTDLVGLARVHGGLGRVLFEQDLVTARRHFQQDLEICQRLGDQRGLTLMHSWLGKCDLREGQTSRASEHYARSEYFAQNSVDRLFTIIGNLRVAATSGPLDEVNRRGKQLLAWFRHERGNVHQIPPTARDELRHALQEARQRTTSGWMTRIEQYLCPGSSPQSVRYDSPDSRPQPAFSAAFRQLRAAFSAGPRVGSAGPRYNSPPNPRR